MFVVTGARYTAAAADAAQSVQDTNPWLRIGIYTDQPMDNPLFDFVGTIDGSDSRRKHDYVGLSPFAETLYLDSDIRVTSDLSDLFRLLERFEIAGAHVRYRSSPRRLGRYQLDLPQAFPQINCGVMLYRKCANVDALFKSWGEIYRAGGFTRDQIPFREALWKSDARLYIFGPEYNTRNIPLFPGKQPLPYILHINAFHAASNLKRWGLHLLLMPVRRRLRHASAHKRDGQPAASGN